MVIVIVVVDTTISLSGVLCCVYENTNFVCTDKQCIIVKEAAATITTTITCSQFFFGFVFFLFLILAIFAWKTNKMKEWHFFRFRCAKKGADKFVVNRMLKTVLSLHKRRRRSNDLFFSSKKKRTSCQMTHQRSIDKICTLYLRTNDRHSESLN